MWTAFCNVHLNIRFIFYYFQSVLTIEHYWVAGKSFCVIYYMCWVVPVPKWQNDLTLKKAKKVPFYIFTLINLMSLCVLFSLIRHYWSAHPINGVKGFAQDTAAYWSISCFYKTSWWVYPHMWTDMIVW